MCFLGCTFNKSYTNYFLNKNVFLMTSSYICSHPQFSNIFIYKKNNDNNNGFKISAFIFALPCYAV